MAETSIGKPYQELIGDGYKIRNFFDNVDDAELVWHRDRKKRIVEVIVCDSWQLQMDNELPFVMQEGCEYEIPAMVYHRIIKGKGILKLKIKEDKCHSNSILQKKN